MAAIRVAGVRGDPCGAVRWTVYGWSQAECTLVGILNSVFFKFLKFFKIFKYSVTLARHRHTP